MASDKAVEFYEEILEIRDYAYTADKEDLWTREENLVERIELAQECGEITKDEMERLLDEMEI